MGLTMAGIGGLVLLVAMTGPAQAGLKEGSPTVLITGANRGIGLEFARQFADRGWNIIATVRSLDGADELKALAAGHPQLVLEELDVTDHAAIEAMAIRYQDQPIDVLLSNAAITPRDPSVFRGLGAINYDLARQSYEVNALAPLKLGQAFLENVAASNGRKIVALSSKAGSFAAGPEMSMMYEYRASKAALNMFVHTMAYETARKDVIVVAMSPGGVNTTPGVRMPGNIEPEESVTKMLKVIDGLTTEHNGRFLNFEEGEEIGW